MHKLDVHGVDDSTLPGFQVDCIECFDSFPKDVLRLYLKGDVSNVGVRKRHTDNVKQCQNHHHGLTESWNGINGHNGGQKGNGLLQLSHQMEKFEAWPVRVRDKDMMGFINEYLLQSARISLCPSEKSI